MIVVDASVAVQWVITEPQTAIANELLDNGLPLIAPAIARVEVGNAIIRRLRVGEFDVETTERTCRKWDRLLHQGYLSLMPVDELFDRAVELAIRCRHPLPDCLYLAAAMHLNATLLTADATFFERARKTYEAVEMLAKAA